MSVQPATFRVRRLQTDPVTGIAVTSVEVRVTAGVEPARMQVAVVDHAHAGTVTGVGVARIVQLTNTAYLALPVKDPTTLYVRT